MDLNLQKPVPVSETKSMGLEFFCTGNAGGEFNVGSQDGHDEFIKHAGKEFKSLYMNIVGDYIFQVIYENIF